MARSDLLADLVAHGISGDRARFSKVVEALIAEERSKKHIVLADRLKEILFNSPRAVEKDKATNGHSFEHRGNDYYQEIFPKRNLLDLLLPSDVQSIISEVVAEHNRVDLLRSYSLEPRNRLLFIGPPGNGKTSLAEALAESLMIPLLRVRYDGIVGAYLGETAVRLRRLLEAARSRKCVLFFDEFETIAKERGDTHDTGEIKRVVSSLLLQIDDLPSHVIVVGATNHPELLDRAVWRRFQVRVELPLPNKGRIAEWLSRFEKRYDVSFGHSVEVIAKKLNGSNFAEVEEFAMSIIRKHVLSLPDSNIKSITDSVLSTWFARTVNINSRQGEDS